MLIGLNGQLGSGKDTVYERALVLAVERGLPAPIRVSFADKLKRACAAAIGVHPSILEHYKRDKRAKIILSVPAKQTVTDTGTVWEETYSKKSITIREFMQFMGTEVGRDIFGENFWVDQALPMDFDHKDKLVFVTDVRFPNEARRVMDLGGNNIRVLNGPLNEDGHASEQVLGVNFIHSEFDNSVRDDNYAAMDAFVETLL